MQLFFSNIVNKRENMNKMLSVTILAIVLGLISACAHNVSPNTYQASEAGIASKVLPGIIIGKRPVKINASSGLGTIGGAGIGAAGGAAMGNGSSSHMAGAIAGALIGGVVGSAMEKGIHTHKAFEYIIQLNNHSTISIVQAEAMEFNIEQPVLIIYGATTRIVPDCTIKIYNKQK